MSGYGFTADGGPVRPYADQSQLGVNAGRTGQFNRGITGDQGNIATSAGQDPGLNLNGQQFNSQVPRSAVQTSVLQNPMPSANGMSATDAARMLPGGQPGRPVMLPTSNASSQDSYARSLLMRLNGLDAQ